MKKYIVVLSILMMATLAQAADWSNLSPQSGADSAGQLLLKHEANATRFFASCNSSTPTGYLNCLKQNFTGTTSPTAPSTGQAWHDSTNNLMKFYSGSWGNVGLFSSAMSSFTGGITSSGTNTWSGSNTFSGTTVATGTVYISAPVISSGTNTWTGSNVFSNATGTITASMVSATTQTVGVNTIVHTKIVDIGNWNMDTTISVDIAHGLTLNKIRGVSVIIRRDDNAEYDILNRGLNAIDTTPQVFAAYASATIIQLVRLTGSTVFDTANYDDVPFNRGWITITYVE